MQHQHHHCSTAVRTACTKAAAPSAKPLHATTNRTYALLLSATHVTACNRQAQLSVRSAVSTCSLPSQPICRTHAQRFTNNLVGTATTCNTAAPPMAATCPACDLPACDQQSKHNPQPKAIPHHNCSEKGLPYHLAHTWNVFCSVGSGTAQQT